LNDDGNRLNLPSSDNDRRRGNYINTAFKQAEVEDAGEK
jgi:hypothetical protein